ncbi:protein transport protein SEC61 subunit beta, putative [Plasmodium ovale curtisi]|uniref:Protein transport protein SEC61 subunit beta, putative n=1 Tax=Plasmodium ovale curtisi TaxID=864141 RepID=A0A1A8WKW9_PLAOA|nr:protein transport protein SEC61 subunit beta, putative [Plasmodium ovale curtisi]SBS92794.1 protein transport protein SEC61 subunit beta, putative [Plasmodium ovale curtisi]
MNGNTPVIVGGMRTPARRRQSTGSQSNNTKPRRSGSGNTNSIIKFYGDDSPGFKLYDPTNCFNLDVNFYGNSSYPTHY